MGVRLMPDETENKTINHKYSAEKLMSAKNLTNVLKTLFAETTIIDTEVKKGAKSSANIYVNKKFEGKKATVIIW
jgi:hypothetical protein